MAQPKKIEISHRTIIFTVFFLIFLWFLYFIRDLLLQLFLALVIMAILNPLVTKLSKYKIPRAVSVFVAYLIFIGVIVGVIAGIAPPLIEQSGSFVNNFPRYLNGWGLTYYLGEQTISNFVSQLGALPAQVAKFTVSLFSNILSVITVLLFAFYMLLSRDKLDDQLSYLFGDKKEKRIGALIDRLEEQLGGWARGQLTLMFLVGISTYVGLKLLGIPFALPLSILAGILEVVPYIGPIISAVPAVMIGFGISPIIGLATTALAFLIQQIENYAFVPKVMEKSVGVNPIITLLSLTIGFKVAGVVGVIISVPLVITIRVLVKEYMLASK
jgi:predicted PurR-regulated permease PerM